MDKRFPSLSVDLIDVAKRSDGLLNKLSEAELLDIKNRYLQFLYLVRKYPYNSICPTFDVNEIWRLHILHPKKYYQDCMNYFGCILDHNPLYGEEVPEFPHSQDIYNESKIIWSNEFKEKYNTSLSDKVRSFYQEDLKKSETKTYNSEQLKAASVKIQYTP